MNVVKMNRWMALSAMLVLMLASACSTEETEETESDALLLAVLAQPAPQVRVRNSSGTTENYAIMEYSSSSSCSSTVIHSYSDNPVSSGSSTSYAEVPAGEYSIRFATNNCVRGPFIFQSGSRYTCISGVSTISCSAD